jgi:hypothetical protein
VRCQTAAANQRFVPFKKKMHTRTARKRPIMTIRYLFIFKKKSLVGAANSPELEAAATSPAGHGEVRS